MVAFTKINSFLEKLAEKEMNLQSDTLKIALTAAANPILATNTVLADLTEISYTNCSTRALTVSSSAQTSGTYKLVVADLTITATGGAVGPFQYVGVYDDTHASDALIAFYNLGSEVTLADGQSFLFDFDGTNGLLQIA